MTNEQWLKSLETEELASVLESFSCCSRCPKRGNSCFPESIDMWLLKEREDEKNDET